MKTSQEETERYFEQRKTGLWTSEAPQILGRLPLKLIDAFHALPPCLVEQNRMFMCTG